MTIDEKLELFYKTTMDEATAQSVAMVEEYEKEIDKKYMSLREELEYRAEQTYRMDSEQLIHEKNKAVSEANREIRKQLSEEKQEFVEAVFKDVMKRLKEYKETKEYEESLAKQILEAKKIAAGSPFIVYINEDDKDIKKQLETKTGVEILLSKTDFMGGTRAVLREQNILIDNSYLAKLSEERETYKLQ